MQPPRLPAAATRPARLRHVRGVVRPACRAVTDTVARSERFVSELESLEDDADAKGALEACDARIGELSREIDAAYSHYFALPDLVLVDGSTRSVEGLTEAGFQRLAREEAPVRG